MDNAIVFMKWTRKAEVTEVGGLAVRAEPGDTHEDLFEKAKNGEWANFRVLSREYGDEEWTFGPFDPDDTPDIEMNDDDFES